MKKYKKAANQVRILADQTLRAIQPINCSGPKCPSPTLSMNSIVPAIREIDMMMPDMRGPIPPMFDVFSFKQTDDKNRNLRGIES